VPHVSRPGRYWNRPGLSLRPKVEDDNLPAVARPNGANLVDPDDPAFGHICKAAMQLIEFGYDPNDPDVAERAIEVGRKMHEESPALRAERLVKEAARGRYRLEGTNPGHEVVYYVRIGNRVKIGWSTNLPSRLAAINPEEVMVIEPGGRELEKARHGQFRALRTHGEWFKLEEPLTGHIEELRRADAEVS